MSIVRGNSWQPANLTANIIIRSLVLGTNQANARQLIGSEPGQSVDCTV
ncbi:MAG: hypothetical protein IPP36_08650 [Nitrosomonadales bacterium]|nr:hypothetical protein [Nitrosomonadales bacterium]